MSCSALAGVVPTHATTMAAATAARSIAPPLKRVAATAATTITAAPARSSPASTRMLPMRASLLRTAEARWEPTSSCFVIRSRAENTATSRAPCTASVIDAAASPLSCRDAAASVATREAEIQGTARAMSNGKTTNTAATTGSIQIAIPSAVSSGTVTALARGAMVWA